MATNFPTSIDSFTNPSSGDTLDSPSHSAQHTNINDAMVAVQTKLGVGSGTIGTWTAFTPTWTNLTVGNGTYDWSLYSKVNDIVFFSMRFTLGSTSSVGTNPEFTLPVATSNNTQLSLGTGRIAQGANFWFAWPYMVSNKIQVWLFGASSTYVTRVSVTSAAPGSWASGHSIYLQGSYYV